MENENSRDRKRQKAAVLLIGTALIIASLFVFAAIGIVILPLFGFSHESAGGFFLYFILSSVVSYPLNLIAGAWPKALLNLDRITRKTAVCLYVLLDSATTFCGFHIVDSLMPGVSASPLSLLVLALVCALFGIRDIRKKES